MKFSMEFEGHIIKRLNQYIIGLYHRSQGEDTHIFQEQCCNELKAIIEFSEIKWEVKSERPIEHLHIDEGGHSSLVKYYKIDYSGVYHVITLYRKNGIIFNSQDNYLFEFILPHIAASFRLNMLSLFNQGSRSSIDRGVCNERGIVVEAELGFYQQLTDRKTDRVDFTFLLDNNSESTSYFIHQSNLTFYITKKFGFHYLELDKSINNLTDLTNKQKEICYLLKRSLSNKAIAKLSKSSRKTVEHHLVAIYEKLEIKGRGNLVSILNQ